MTWRAVSARPYTAADFARAALKAALEGRGAAALAPNLDITWRNWDLYLQMQNEQLTSDLMYAVGSLVFVFAYIWLTTGRAPHSLPPPLSPVT